MPDDQRRRPVTEITFSFPRIEEVVEELPSKQVDELDEKSKKLVPTVEAILLSDFLVGKDNWDVVEHWHSTIDGKFKRDDDWDKALENKQFTAQRALSYLEALREPERPQIEGKPALNQSEAPAKVSGNSEVGSSFLDKPSTWIAVVVAALFAGVFAIRASRKKAD
jgi:hypothetical protein